jgi:NAD+ diphosphatase
VSAAQAAGVGEPEDQEFTSQLGGFVLARSTVDRMSARRGDPEWVAATWADPRTRVLVLDQGRALVRFGAKDAALVLVPVSQAPEGLSFLLGVDDAGVAYFGVMGPPGSLESRAETAGAPPAAQETATEETAAEETATEETAAEETAAEETAAEETAAEETAAEEAATGETAAEETVTGETAAEETDPGEAAAEETGPGEAAAQETAQPDAWLHPALPGVRPAGLREAASLLSDRDAGLLTHAVALANWHAVHTHCPRCGTLTVPIAAGNAQRCPNDGSEHFPRIDPAVIMLVTDPDDRCLLARNRRWPERRVSILAGFVEPGESAEQAVTREVKEETAIGVGRVRYVGSQPWPMPQSLMLGFRAEATGSLDVQVDDEEIAEAHWYSRDDLRTALATEEVLLPPPVSIAHRLIESWYGEELPGAQ